MAKPISSIRVAVLLFSLPVMSTTTYDGCVATSQGNDTVALQCLGRHLTSVSNDVQTVSDDVHSLQMGVDIFFLIFAATIMFFMQAGFTMLCAGSVRVSVTYFLVMVTRSPSTSGVK